MVRLVSFLLKFHDTQVSALSKLKLNYKMNLSRVLSAQHYIGDLI